MIRRKLHFSQWPPNGGVSNGGVSRSGLVLSFFVLFCPFRDFSGIFSICSGNGPGIFPIGPFPLSWPSKSTYEEQSRKGPRNNLDLSRKSGKPPGLETPRLSFSQFSVLNEIHRVPTRVLTETSTVLTGISTALTKMHMVGVHLVCFHLFCLSAMLGG